MTLCRCDGFKGFTCDIVSGDLVIFMRNIIMDDGIARIFKKETAKVSLNTEIIGKKIYVYDLVTSTNDLAHFLAQKGEPEGTVVFAKGQTEGRGRLGNTWVSPYGKGLYFSFILRPRFNGVMASRVTLTVALAVARALEEIHIERVTIKWPNDILVGDKKVCGILTEMHLEADIVGYLVTGIGLNVNTTFSELPEGAVSLKEASKRLFDIADLSHIIITHIDCYYALLCQDKFSEILTGIKERSGLILGGRVRIECQEKIVEGYAVDFDENGALIIRSDNGFLEKVLTGHLVKLD